MGLLFDDATEISPVLINRLKKHSQVNNVWVFSGNVHGKMIERTANQVDVLDKIADEIKKIYRNVFSPISLS